MKLRCALSMVAGLGCSLAALTALADPPQPPSGVVTPAEHLGRELGADFTLVDWNEVVSYYRKLDEQSPNVRMWSLGKTTEGRDLLVAAISSEANLANLDALKVHARTLADPRGKTPEQKETALREGKVFVVIAPSMHSNEVGAVPMAMELAHQLATSNDEPWKSARDNAVVFLLPTLNPDGLDHIVEWYRKTVKTPYEGTDLLRLYQLYTGHDNNRDWFMMSQAETRLLTKMLYHDVFPQILWDVHQQRGGRERFFIPPYRDPMNPNIDPDIVAAINLLGTRAVLDLNREGFTGVATGSTYDMWWNGGNRSTPARHNIVGILTEAANANLASPVFLRRTELKSSIGDVPYGPSVSMINPWPGGWWRLRDIMNYELAFGRSLLATINREPRLWKETTLRAAERAVAGETEGVRAWIIPADNRDPTAVRRLVDALLLGGVELHVTPGEFTAAGRTYPAGSIVIRRDQPYGAYVKDLFELQKYPELKRPYDTAGWTLPLLMGVQRVEVFEPIPADASLVRVADVAEATKAFTAPELAIADSGTWGKLARQLGEGKAFTLTTEGPAAGTFVAVSSSEPATQQARESVVLRKTPRIGIYSPWAPSIDEGWLRWVFENSGVPYVTLRNEAIRAGQLEKVVDVIIIPSISPKTLAAGRAYGTVPEQYSGGLSPEGAAAIETFVRGGGTLITFGNASNWAVELLKLPLINTTVGDNAKGFACTGSVLRGIPAAGNRFTVGLPDSLPLFFADDQAWREMSKADREKGGFDDRRIDTLLHYAPTEVLLSGYIAKPETIQGAGAWLRVSHGKGRVHLFGFAPHFRAWTQGTIPLIYRAAFFEQ